MAATLRDRYIGIALTCGTVALCLSAAINLYTVRRQNATRIASHSVSPDVAPGRKVPPLVATSLDGTPVTVNFSAGRSATVLYIFTPQCIWCERNLPNLRAAIAATGSKYRFIGLSLSNVGNIQFAHDNQLSMRILTEPTRATIEAYDLGGTPVTLIISPDSKVVANWQGAWIEPVGGAAEKFFGIRLPGLTPLPTTRPGGQQ